MRDFGGTRSLSVVHAFGGRSAELRLRLQRRQRCGATLECKLWCGRVHNGMSQRRVCTDRVTRRLIVWDQRAVHVLRGLPLPHEFDQSSTRLQVAHSLQVSGAEAVRLAAAGELASAEDVAEPLDMAAPKLGCEQMRQVDARRIDRRRQLRKAVLLHALTQGADPTCLRK